MDDIKPEDFEASFKRLRGFPERSEKIGILAARADAKASDATSRIRAWIIAANAAALLICFNSMLTQRICDWSLFRPLVFLFVIGLALTFASVMASRRADQTRMRLAMGAQSIALHAAEQITELEALKESVQSGDEKKAKEHVDRLEAEFQRLDRSLDTLGPLQTPVWYIVSNICELGGWAAPAGALIWAVSDERFVRALCSAAN